MTFYAFCRAQAVRQLEIFVLATLCLLSFLSSPTSAGSAQHFYDPGGRLTVTVDPVNGSAQYTYDSVGNILSVVTKSVSSLVVAQLSPSSGAAGTSVTIAGTGFGTTANTTVSFNGTAATVSSVSSTQIVVIVPSGATSGQVSVTSPAGTVKSANIFTILQTTLPSISSFSPGQVDQGGAVTITGTGFDTVLVNNKVFINGRYAAVTAASATSLTVTAPAVGSGPLKVTTPRGTISSNSNLIVAPLPYLASQVGSVTSGSLGNSVTSTINTAGQIGLVLFNASVGQRFAMQVTNSSLGGTVALYGPDGSAVVLPTGIYSGLFFDVQVLSQTGFYTIVLSGGGQTGSATLNLFNVPPDATASISANGTAVAVTTSTAGQNASVSFSGTAGQKVSLQMQYSGNFGNCAAMTILAPDGITQVYSDGCSTRYTDVVVLPTTGTYTIYLNIGGVDTGTATFTLYNVPADATASISPNGTAVAVTTSTPGQNASVSFTGTAGQRVSLQMQYSGNFGNCAAMTILAPDGTTQIYTDGCSTRYTDVVVLPTTGNYKISLNIGGPDYGTVTFTLYNVPADATASISANGTAVAVTTSTPGQNANLSFSGTAGQRISLQTQYSGNFSNCAAMTILAPDGTTQIYTDGCSTRFTDAVVLPTTGTYKISLNIGGPDYGTVTFTLYAVPPDATATISANGTAVPVTTTAPGQNISVSFSGTAGQRVSVQMQYSNTFTQCATMTILAPDGVTQIYSDGCSTRFTDVVVLPTTGTSTIYLNIGGADTGTATFTLYNDQNAAATITPGGGSIGVTIAQPGQNAVLSFAGTAGKRVSLLTQLDTGLTASCDGVQVLQPDGTTQLYNNNICAASDFSGALPKPPSVSSTVLTLSSSGTYTIPFNPGGTATGVATFTLYDVPADVAGSTTAGSVAANYTTSTPGQAIRVTFPGTANQSATVSIGVINSVPASPCYNITTLDPDGATILRGDQSCSSAYSSGSLTLPQSGTYTIVLAPTSTTTGTFSARVTTP